MKVRERSLGKVSVVHIARAVVSQAVWVEERVLWAVGILARIFLMGRLCGWGMLVKAQWFWEGVLRAYGCPITPVLMTIVLPPLPSSCPSKHSSTFSPILCASSMPFLPVTAFAHPEFTTTARTPLPPLLCSISLLTTTGAAWNLFFVKTAAPEHGVSDAINARSGNRVFVGLTPACVPETRKPLG